MQENSMKFSKYSTILGKRIIVQYEQQVHSKSSMQSLAYVIQIVNVLSLCHYVWKDPSYSSQSCTNNIIKLSQSHSHLQLSNRLTWEIIRI